MNLMKIGRDCVNWVHQIQSNGEKDIRSMFVSLFSNMCCTLLSKMAANNL